MANFQKFCEKFELENYFLIFPINNPIKANIKVKNIIEAKIQFHSHKIFPGNQKQGNLIMYASINDRTLLIGPTGKRSRMTKSTKEKIILTIKPIIAPFFQLIN